MRTRNDTKRVGDRVVCSSGRERESLCLSVCESVREREREREKEKERDTFSIVNSETFDAYSYNKNGELGEIGRIGKERKKTNEGAKEHNFL